MDHEKPIPFKMEMRRLAGIAYQRELDLELTEVYKEFKKWEKGKLDCFKLNDVIHKYHDETARYLWKLNHMKPDYLTARGIGKNIIKNEEVNPKIMEYLKDKIEYIRQENGV
jgi:hypothetical protein